MLKLIPLKHIILPCVDQSVWDSLWFTWNGCIHSGSNFVTYEFLFWACEFPLNACNQPFRWKYVSHFRISYLRFLFQFWILMKSTTHLLLIIPIGCYLWNPLEFIPSSKASSWKVDVVRGISVKRKPKE